MNPNINKVHNKIIKNKNKKKEYTQSQINRCEIAIMVMNSRVKHKTEHKTMEIQTYRHAFINRKLHNYYILFLSHLPSCVSKLMSVLQRVICVGIEFHRDAPAKEKLDAFSDVSSANISQFIESPVICKGRSLIKIRKRRGTRIEPWGIPYRIMPSVEYSPFM